jgi:hypothetical protein
LVSIAAAFAVNCTSSLERHLAASRTLAIAEDGCSGSPWRRRRQRRGPGCKC